MSKPIVYHWVEGEINEFKRELDLEKIATL